MDPRTKGILNDARRVTWFALFCVIVFVCCVLFWEGAPDSPDPNRNQKNLVLKKMIETRFPTTTAPSV